MGPTGPLLPQGADGHRRVTEQFSILSLSKRWEIEDGLEAALHSRRAQRPQSRLSYQERALREMRARIGRDVLVNARRAAQ